MYSTESTMFLSPSLLTCPCGRWAALPQIGSVVSTRRLSQYIASSMRGLPWVQTAPARLGRDVTLADVGAKLRGEALRVAGRRDHAVEVDLGARRDEVADPLVADAEAIDLLEEPRAVGIEGLPRLLLRRHRPSAVLLPRKPVGLPRHVRQRVHAVVRLQRDLVHRPIIGAATFFVERAPRIQIAVGWAIELGGVALEGMRAELLDVDGHRRGQALRAERVEAQRATVRARQERQAVLLAGLVAGHERGAVLDGGV